MAKKFLLEITTPERLFLMEMVEMVILSGAEGENGIMAGHEKMVVALISGIIRIQNDDQWRVAAISEGYAVVYGDRVVVLLQSIEWAEEIDVERAMAAKARAEQRLLTDQATKDRVLTKMALGRANARLKLIKQTKDKDN